MWVMCPTTGCENYGVPIDVGPMSYVDEETGETVTIPGASCGPCGTPLTPSETEPEPLVDLEPEEGLTDG